MKYYANKFEEYLITNERKQLHSTILKHIHLTNDIHKLSNIIIYGPPGIGKYTQSLNIIKHYSLSNLKYERKINITFNKKDYFFKVSDIHIEIDMDLLGCNAKTLFNDIFYHTMNIFSGKELNTCIILCKNFHNIHSDLLNIFYSYMQNMLNNKINLKFIIITEHLSFMPKNIINICNIVSFNRPSKTKYNNCLNMKNINNGNIQHIKNIKNLKSNIFNINDKFKDNCHQLINMIENYQDIKFINVRDKLYSLCINNYDIFHVIYYILQYLIKNKRITNDKFHKILINIYKTIRLYNNNYRPIFHLEKIIYYLIIIIHEL